MIRSIDEGLSNRLANAGLICAVLVVCRHIQRPLGDFWFIRWVSADVSLSMVAVPFFFAVSGYLFLNRFGEKDWWRTALTKRIKSLVIPFFVLNLAWFPLKYGMHYVGVRFFHADDSNAIMHLSVSNF